ncbi:hypothetical protein PHAVU_011G155900 [Phaseolus vulgaris]|uniref:Uncharacterized protein n=1 Tax=Phaseolus vulgaris TaxID=3885 RepID=V7ALZ5_PHAVU|nr:hypothetical protein PHAVU_011G155900g [Phaseolus vulgaris]ESW05146.1 hypothetical protein PHAVU_011G155900g [Phaseolus vulgaris]
MKLTFPLLFILLLSIGIEIVVFFYTYFCFFAESKGPMKVVEGKICDVKLYDYCDEDCYIDCPNMFGARAIGFCNFNPQVCICRRQC